MEHPGDPCDIVRHGAVVYRAPRHHVELVTRTLGIERATWQRALEGYAERWRPEAPVEERLAALRASWEACSPHAAALATAARASCPCCGAGVRPWIARRAPHFTVGRCADCGHGLLLEGAAAASVYQSRAYYQAVDPETRAGYPGYEAERAYREAKGARLLDWIASASGAPPHRLLEVGSGYGFTRSAAEARGIRTAGVDVNPHAAEVARRLYGFDTHVGDLASGLAGGVVPAGEHDLVIYQFVLEHLEDPGAELAVAARALAPGGTLALVVPSAEAAEAEVFGASYRSLRGDHLHLFSRRSLDLLLARAGLAPAASKTECSIHLLLGFLSPDELERGIYQAGRGPDITLLARKPR